MLQRLCQVLVTFGFYLAIVVQSANCPEKCSCAQINGETTVHCRYQRHTEVPGGFPEDTVNIDLSYNDITTLSLSDFSGLNNLTNIKISHCAVTDILSPNNSLRLPTLKALDISHNLISQITTELSKIMPNLRILQLEHNTMKDVPITSFKGMNLQTCSLAHNDITALPQGSLSDLSIETLDLSYNKLTNISENILSNGNKPNIGSLNLAYNTLGRIAEDTFENFDLKELNLRSCNLTSHSFLRYTNVLILDLSDNHFADLDFSQYVSLRTLQSLVLSGYDVFEFYRHTFQTMINLKKLDISRNNLLFMDFSPFTDLIHLEVLTISQNQLAELAPDLCETFSKLKQMRLNMNQLELISLENFEGCTSLQSLDLRNNRMQVFPESIKPVFNRLRLLSLGDNPLHCNCEMEWFSEWLKTAGIFTGADFCETPQRAYLFYLKPEDFTCTPPAITYHSPNLVTPEGSSVVLHCTAEGDPAPEIDWISPHGELIRISPPSDRTINLTQAYWSLHDLHALQAGLYTCLASNPAGNVTANMTITIGQPQTTHSQEYTKTEARTTITSNTSPVQSKLTTLMSTTMSTLLTNSSQTTAQMQHDTTSYNVNPTATRNVTIVRKYSTQTTILSSSGIESESTTSALITESPTHNSSSASSSSIEVKSSTSTSSVTEESSTSSVTEESSTSSVTEESQSSATSSLSDIDSTTAEQTTSQLNWTLSTPPSLPVSVNKTTIPAVLAKPETTSYYRENTTSSDQIRTTSHISLSKQTTVIDKTTRVPSVVATSHSSNTIMPSITSADSKVLSSVSLDTITTEGTDNENASTNMFQTTSPGHLPLYTTTIVQTVSTSSAQLMTNVTPTSSSSTTAYPQLFSGVDPEALTLVSKNATPDSLVETRPPTTDRITLIITVVTAAAVSVALLSGLVVTLTFMLRRKQSKQVDYEVGGRPTTSTEAICKELETEA